MSYLDKLLRKNDYITVLEADPVKRLLGKDSLDKHNFWGAVFGISGKIAGKIIIGIPTLFTHCCPVKWQT